MKKQTVRWKVPYVDYSLNQYFSSRYVPDATIMLDLRPKIDMDGPLGTYSQPIILEPHIIIWVELLDRTFSWKRKKLKTMYKMLEMSPWGVSLKWAPIRDYILFQNFLEWNSFLFTRISTLKTRKFILLLHIWFSHRCIYKWITAWIDRLSPTNRHFICNITEWF